MEEGWRTVGVVGGREEERRAEGTTEVGGSGGVLTVVVVVVCAAAVAGIFLVVILDEVEGAALIHRREVLHNDAAHVWEGGQVDGDSREAVKPVVPFDSGAILPEMLVVSGDNEAWAGVVEAEVECAVMIAQHVDLIRDGGVAAARLPKDDTHKVFQRLRLTAHLGQGRCAAPLRHVAYANREGEGKGRGARIVDAEVERFAVPQYALHIVALGGDGGTQIVRVERSSHGKVAPCREPSARQRDGHETRRVERDLGDGTCVGREEQVAAA